MADSGKNAITTNNGNGSSTTFDIGFEYLDTSHIQVVVDSVTQVLGTDYDISTDGDDVVFRAGSIPAVGTGNIVFTRVTPSTSLIVDPTAGAGLQESDVENLIWQALYFAEEVQDGI